MLQGITQAEALKRAMHSIADAELAISIALATTADVLVVIDDKLSVMTPQTDRGRSLLFSEITFAKGTAEFFLPANIAHFEANGLKVEIRDNRKEPAIP